MVNAFAALSEHQTHGNERLRTPEEEDAAFHVRGQHPAECASAHPLNKRHSWDLETHDLDKRSHERLERVPSRRLHHEWPQTKEDIEQHEFCSVKRSQINCEEGWYIGACKRIDAEHALHLVNKNGAFLVRDCSNSSDSEPLVLVVFHDKKVYNVKIRFIESTGKYALGTGLQSNEMFDSVADIIKFHSLFPIILISGRNISGIKYPDNCVLTCPISKGDVELLLQ
ncbi:lymphocyte cytosolic protein 2 [Menidia menidia]